jgi:hypothetical protein
MPASLLVTITALGSIASADRPTSPLHSANSASFVVRSYQGGPPADEVLQRCRHLRLELQRVWLGAASGDAWRPTCDVVLHATRGNYLQAVGRGGGQTLGSSFVEFTKGRIASRRIDLLVDQQGHISALPHELTHVVLADQFGGRQPPRWIDEGIATMADSVEKRTLHQRDCRSALRDGTALRVIDLLRLEQFTAPQQVPAFYGQSLSLVRFLAEQDEPKRIVEFADAALEQGYDRALQQHYAIEDVAALERHWRDYAQKSTKAQTPVIAAAHRP